MRLVAYSDNREWGGADHSMSHLLARLEADVEVTVMGVSADIVERIARARSGSETRVVRPPRSGQDWRSLHAHVRALRGLAPDIVHANLSSPWSCQYCLAAARLLRRPRVVAVYQLVVPAVNRRQRWAKRLASPAVDRHVGVGERVSRDVEDVVGLRRGSVQTIHNGVPDDLQAEVPRPRPGMSIGAIGRVEAQKGFDVLIRALPEIEAATLVLVGDGSERRNLQHLARELGVEERIVWVGWSDDARGYLRSVDVFALPSRFEGFPLALLEAMLAELPVVATDVGSVAEAVHDGDTGLLVPRDDPTALARAITRLLGDAHLRRTLGENARRLVLERFTADHMTRRFEALYRELLG